MIKIKGFLELIPAAIPKFARYPLSNRQKACIKHPSTNPLMIVAGPGSGKTTVLVLRALRLLFVEGFMPEQVMITTFTRKAAEEIRARLIEWGLLIVEHLRNFPSPDSDGEYRHWIESVDVNRFITGTLDSICEEVLTRLRHPSDPVSVVVEEFIANSVLKSQGLRPANAHPNANLDTYLSDFSFGGNPPANFGEKLRICRTIIDHIVHDQVDLSGYRTGRPNSSARQCVADSATGYWTSLANRNLLDFSLLEQTFLNRLRIGRLDRFTEKIKGILVDEYQDTNAIQESIYFELVRSTRASFTIVGDDDQSLYRFRGATVELFRDFVTRYQTALGDSPQIRYLVDNYRSTPEIVTFFNEFIDNDSGFLPARVSPPKPRIRYNLPSNGVPVLGMFRSNREELSNDLSNFLKDVFRGGGRITNAGVRIVADPEDGDCGDAVFLSHTVNEYARGFGDRSPRPRLPLLLRRALETNGIGVFNPRGRALRDISIVQHLLGTMLLCIDPPKPATPNGAYLADLNNRHALRGESFRYLCEWRQQAKIFIDGNPRPNRPHTLSQFVQSWQNRRPQGAMRRWPDEWPLLELCFKLITWIPFLQNDPEGQIYLEAVARVIAQAATFSAYRATLVFNDPDHAQRSVQGTIMDILAPIAENDVELDEDIMPTVPRDRMPFMTIHQSKGLEFPLVIVDVSSDYTTNNHMQRFRRFPETPSNISLLEDDLSNHCAIGPLRTARSSIDRTFDDLVRLYYVAYSRPHSVLMLVGLSQCLRYNTPIKHIATCWRRNNTWPWQTTTNGRPALADNIPLHLI